MTIDGEASDNAFQYTGRENDGTGLYYYRARYYSPELQRFISEDPIGFDGGDLNLYAYVQNNPVNAIDPLGLFDFCVQRRIGNKTTITCSSSSTVYTLTEPAILDPLNPYEKDQPLEPGVYVLLPRPTKGRALPKASPVYTTPGQKAGAIITPTGKIRGVPLPAGPHVAGPEKRSAGCPLFPNTKEGRRQKEEFYRHFKENINTGGTWIVIVDVGKKGGLINEY